MDSVLRLSASAADFDQRLAQRLAWEAVSDDQVANAVAEIIATVRREGDAAVVEYTRRFDGLDVGDISELSLSHAQLQAELEGLPDEQRDALTAAAERLRRYHEHQRQESWQYRESDGTLLGQQVRPLDRAGLYVPGGKASYPSSVLMNAIPANVAGVGELVMVVPTPKGERNSMVLAAAALAGVDRVFTVGGAQAVAAMAYGTQTIPRVDKITGPGNTWVATAKRQVFGQVGIDMIAGPSEICVVCDGKTDPDWIAMDLFSQAEHDELAQAILVSTDAGFLDAVQASMDKLVQALPRREVIETSMRDRGVFIQVEDMGQAIEVVNTIAPEHLELSVDDAERWATEVRHAGAIFMGRYTAEALGDYCAGPNHVLPTSGTARYSSPLGVYDFQKRSSLIACSPEGAAALGQVASVLAEGEGLQAHAESARYRIPKG
ncbi:MAG: histidinol dehydrogenase [Granulosicoccaceae bacterium]